MIAVRGRRPKRREVICFNGRQLKRLSNVTRPMFVMDESATWIHQRAFPRWYYIP